jgi:glyoxylase-like metal-dependent hydrolase (beta-lactamase superfamily II)
MAAAPTGTRRFLMRVVAVSTGAVRGKRRERGVRRYLPGGWSDRTLPINVFAIEHPAGLCVFDTGQTARAARPGYLPRWHPFLRLARFELSEADEVGPQLARTGVDVAQTRWVVLSHLHTDHVGGLDAFPDAEVLVSTTEWRRSRGLAGRLRGYVPHRWPSGLVPRLVDPAPPGTGPFTASYDVVGDGALLVVPTPGHTPGHVSLLLQADASRYLLVGDLVHEAAELETADPVLAAWCRENGVVILASHDAHAADAISSAAARR